MVTTKSATVDDLLEMPDDGWQYELVAGEITRMPPAGAEHGETEGEFVFHLRLYLSAPNAGRVYTGDTGFLFDRDPLTVRAPDVAVVRAERLPPKNERRGYLALVPDLVVEIVSPSERPSDIDAKVAFYLAHGVPLVWVAYPVTGTAEVYRPGALPRRLGPADALNGEEILPGFRLPLAAVFR